MNEVNDCRSSVGICCNRGRINLHTESAEGSSTKGYGVLELRHRLRNINKNVAALLHRVAVNYIMLTLTCTIYFAHSGQLIAAECRLKVDECIA